MSKFLSAIRFRSIILLLILSLFVGAAFFFFRYQSFRTEVNQLKSQLGVSQDLQKELQRKQAIIAEVQQIYDIPPEEEPSVATVTNVETLKNDPFFAKAKNG